MRRAALMSLLCIFSCSSLTACYDAKEIDAWAYVYTIGVDKGVSDVLRFTFQIPSMKDGGGGNEGVGKGAPANYTAVSVDCPTFYTGVNMIETSQSRTMNYMHAKYLVIGEDLAREGVERFMNGMIRSRQMRRIMHVIIVKGKASDFVEAFNPTLTAAVSKAQEGLMNQKDETGLFVDTTYHHFMKDMKTDYRMPAAPLAALNDFSSFRESGTPPGSFRSEGQYYAGEIPRKGGNDFEVVGTALFDGDKMVGELDGNETRVMLMVRDDFTRGFIAIQDPQNKKLRITIDTKLQKKPGIKVRLDGPKPVIYVKLSLEGDIQNLQSTTAYESIKLKPVLENAFKEYIKGILDRTIDKCKNLHVDVFGFGEKAVTHFLTIQEWEKYNWLGKFKDAEVATEVEFVIRRTGTMLKTNPVRGSEGEKE